MNTGVPRNTPGARDAFVLALAILSLVVSCLMVSAGKEFWNDELYSWYLLADPSFSGMWAAFNDKLNNTPGLYFVTGWIWARLFGASELSLRLFSSLGICAAMAVVWLTLRRVYSFWPTCIGTLTVFLTSTIVLSQNAEARMYGLFLLMCAVAVYQFVYLDTRGQYGFGDLIRVALVHAAIVNTHLFGPFYSGAILAAFVVADLLNGRFRKGIYLAVMAGWLGFLLYLPAFLVQSDAGRPRSWLPIPLLGDFLGLVGLASPSFVHVVFVSALMLCLTLIYVLRSAAPGEAGRHEAVNGAERSLLVMALALILPTAATWLLSRVSRPIFWDRYLVPSIIGYCIVIAHATSLYLGSRRAPARATSDPGVSVGDGRRLIGHVVLSGFVAVLLLNPLWYAVNVEPRAPAGRDDRQFGYEELPAVVEAPGGFLERWHYRPDRERYYFILDEAAAMRQESGLFGPQSYKHMDAYRRNYERLHANILSSEDFLARFDRFIVIDYLDFDAACPSRVFGLQNARDWHDIHCPQWVETRLLSNPDYVVTRLGTTATWQSVLLVERTAAGQ